MTRMRAWVVRETEAGMALGELLPRIDERASAALEHGAVFVGGRRVYDAHLKLQRGDRVDVAVARPATDTVEILGERDGLVAVLKPAALPTEPDRSGGACLLSAAAAVLGAPARTLHALGRLDVGVSGIVLLARDQPARQRATRARERGALRKSYLGIAAGVPADAAAGVWTFAVEGRAAETRWRILGQSGVHGRSASLLQLDPLTGRKHQLRTHAAQASMPLYGDRRYGGPTRITGADGSVTAITRIALHACRLELDDWVVEAPLDDGLDSLLRALGINWQTAAGA